MWKYATSGFKSHKMYNGVCHLTPTCFSSSKSSVQESCTAEGSVVCLKNLRFFWPYALGTLWGKVEHLNWEILTSDWNASTFSQHFGQGNKGKHGIGCSIMSYQSRVQSDHEANIAWCRCSADKSVRPYRLLFTTYWGLVSCQNKTLKLECGSNKK